MRRCWSSIFGLGGQIVQLKETTDEVSKLYQRLSKDLIAAFPDVKSFSVTNLKYMQYFYECYSSPQLVDYCKMGIFSIPWGHNRTIIDKCKNNKDKALFYVAKTIENNWSRVVLLNFLDTDLYERQGKAITNFS